MIPFSEEPNKLYCDLHEMEIEKMKEDGYNPICDLACEGCMFKGIKKKENI